MDLVEDEAEEEEEDEEDLVEAVAEEEVEEEEDDLVAMKDHLQKLLVRCFDSSCEIMRHTVCSGLCNWTIGQLVMYKMVFKQTTVPLIFFFVFWGGLLLCDTMFYFVSYMIKFLSRFPFSPHD